MRKELELSVHETEREEECEEGVAVQNVEVLQVVVAIGIVEVRLVL
jgi:hypothetical protein